MLSKVATVPSGAIPGEGVWNEVAQEIDDLGVSVDVRRTDSLALPATTDVTVPWQTTAFDTRGSFWSVLDPMKITIRLDGQYLIGVSAAWTGLGPGGGHRLVWVSKGSTSWGASLINQRFDAASIGIAFPPVSVSLLAGDELYMGVSSTVASTLAADDTYLSLTRFGSPTPPSILTGGTPGVDPTTLGGVS